MRQIRRLSSVCVLLGFLAGCIADSTGPGQEPGEKPSATPVPASVSKTAGDGQSARLGSALGTQLTVRVADASGKAVPGATVAWAVASGGGSVNASSSQTDGNGEARVTWTLGSVNGVQSVTASVGTLPSVTFEARATAFYTVLVYMAADNNLAVAGLKDIEEMEQVGSSDSVQVVVQAEFSPEYLGRAGCASPACYNRPNHNTFRFRVGKGSQKLGPDTPAEDVGNRNMTLGSELADFIQWGKKTYPAEKYVLVLWNHGGGYQGLLEDQTSAGNNLMSLTTLRQGLEGAATKFAIIDFDMCLMGGAETLQSIRGFADFVVFSEELEPGDGNPFDRILAALRAAPGTGSREAAQMMADAFVASYRDSRSSVTKSAVDLGRLTSFQTAWDDLAKELQGNLAAYTPALQQAIPRTQAYDFPYLRDLGDFLTRLKAVSPSASLTGKIDALQSQLSGGMVVRNAFYTSKSYGASNVDRSTGMHVLLPSGAKEDALPSTGPGSLAAYKALDPNSAWGAFLEQWLANSTRANFFDQGEQQMQAALVWDSAAVSRKADVDLWVLEPNGNLYIPYLGVVTPNGTFSGDSYDSKTYYEAYVTKRHIERGLYYFFAELYQDPQNFGPAYTFLYRFGSKAQWVDLYKAPYPRLTLVKSWSDDPTPTLQEAIDGAYTDLKLVAYWDLRTATSASAGASFGLRASEERSRPALQAAARVSAPSPRITAAQQARVQSLLRDPAVRALRENRRAPVAGTAYRPSEGMTEQMRDTSGRLETQRHGGQP
jgi:hypothetical protein